MTKCGRRSKTNGKCLRFTKQELLVSDGILVPATEENRFQPIDDALFLRQVINGIGPKFRDELDDGMGGIDNASMRPVIDS